MRLITPVQWTRQPAQNIGLNRGHLRHNNVKSAYILSADGFVDLISGVRSGTGVVPTPTTMGVGGKSSGVTLPSGTLNRSVFTRIFVATPQVSSTGTISDCSAATTTGAQVQISSTNVALNKSATTNYVNGTIPSGGAFGSAVVCGANRQIIAVNGVLGTPRTGTTSFGLGNFPFLFKRGDGSEVMDSALLLHIELDVEITDSEASSYSQNPWQFLQPKRGIDVTGFSSGVPTSGLFLQSQLVGLGSGGPFFQNPLG